MIYLQSHKYKQSVYIPMGYTKRGGAYRLVLRSTIDLTETVLEVEDERIYGNYYLFSFHLPEGMQTGEYTYKVESNGRTMTEGLAVVRYPEEEIQEYENDIEYEQYNG